MRKLQVNFILCGVLLFIFYVSVNAQPGGVDFQNISFEKALEKARETNKLVFIDCYTSWCGPCKMLSRDIFPQKKVGDFFNQNFICLSFDMEQGDGPSLAARFAVKSYPTLLFLDGNGEVVHRDVGSRNADGMIYLGKLALDPSRNLKGVTQKLNSGDNSFEVIENALRLNRRDKTKTESLLNLYFKDKADDQWFDKNSWTLLSNYASLNSNYGEFLMHNSDRFKELFGKEEVESKVISIVSAFYNSYSSLGYSFESCVKFLDSFHSPLVLKGVYGAKISQARNSILSDAYTKNNWLDYINLLNNSSRYLSDESGLDYQQFVEVFFNKNAYRGEINIERVCKNLNKLGSPLAKKIQNEFTVLKLTALLRGGDLFKDAKELKPLPEKVILQIVNESIHLLDSCSLQKIHANNIAWEMLEHPNRDRFLSLAYAFSKYAVTGFYNFYGYHTHAAICAQMGRFDEALKYEQMAVENVQTTSPKKSDYYTECLEKFKNHQAMF